MVLHFSGRGVVMVVATFSMVTEAVGVFHTQVKPLGENVVIINAQGLVILNVVKSKYVAARGVDYLLDHS